MSRSLKLLTAVLVLDFAVSLYLALFPAPQADLHALYSGAGSDVSCSKTFAVYSPDHSQTYTDSCVMTPDRSLAAYRAYFEALDPNYPLRARVAFKAGKTLVYELVFSTDRRVLVTTVRGSPFALSIVHLVPEESPRDGRGPVTR